MPHTEIARQVINPDTGKPIDEKTLARAFRADLDQGKAKASALVAQSLFKKATQGSGPGAVTAAIFWLKTQARWKEPPPGDENDDDMTPDSRSFTYNVVDGRTSNGDPD